MPGERGEVAIRGPNVIGGYAGTRRPTTRPSSTAGSGPVTRGSSTRGYLVMTGRLKEMINRGGEKIAPREVDEVLLQHPSQAGRGIRGAGRATWARMVAAAVVTDPDGTATRRRSSPVASSLADFKVPTRIVIVDEIPRGPTGQASAHRSRRALGRHRRESPRRGAGARRRGRCRGPRPRKPPPRSSRSSALAATTICSTSGSTR